MHCSANALIPKSTTLKPQKSLALETSRSGPAALNPGALMPRIVVRKRNSSASEMFPGSGEDPKLTADQARRLPQRLGHGIYGLVGRGSGV